MANQAFSESEDLMVGAGGIYFKRSDDANQLHFLGNCTQFNITTDVTTVEKYSSMNKKRELMASVTTQTKATGSIVLNEYNMYNLALALYGTEYVHNQQAKQLTNEAYTVPSVPGIIELTDPDGNRYYNVTSVSVGPANTIAPTAAFAAGPDVSANGATWTQPGAGAGGTVTVNGAGYTGTTNENFVFSIVTAPTAAGDLDGMEVRVATNLLNLNIPGQYTTLQVTTAGTTTATATHDGVTLTFAVGATDSFLSTGNTPMTFAVTAGINTYKEGVDYVIEEESIRGGLIKIKKGGAINAGDVVRVTATVPEADFVTVSGSDAGKIRGELVFIGDPNQGNVVMVEAWNCNVKPDGDLTGLIGDDFGEFTLSIDVMSDYENHPLYPLYKVTKLGNSAEPLGKQGIYDPDE